MHRDECPFCGCDPYEYVDIGVGSQPVAVTCCELGVAYFDRRSADTVSLSMEDFDAIADIFRAMRQLGLKPDLP